MRLTNVLFKKVKSKRIMVVLESVVSGHQYNAFRDRLAEKLEIIRFDPYSEYWNNKLQSINVNFFKNHLFSVQQESLYRERKKIRSA
ncbi:hypothetical protein KR200_000415 [Drosophila serrata]|nr:hypothetical protein KR200_000415 [Drosophila serrata]